MMSLSQQRRRTDKSQSITETENGHAGSFTKGHHISLPTLFIGIGIGVIVCLVSVLFLLHFALHVF
jgi:hypothetical protein